jgi:hypothetical protein
MVLDMKVGFREAPSYKLIEIAQPDPAQLQVRQQWLKMVAPKSSE